MTEFVIRPAEIDDWPMIADFNQRLAQETEGKQLDADALAEGVRRVLGDSSKGQYFVAAHALRIVGQIMLTREWSDWRNGDLLWIQSVYVHPDYRRVGVFRRLFARVQQYASSQPDVVGLRLYVEQNNQAAQAAYRRLGFRNPGYEVMESLPKDD